MGTGDLVVIYMPMVPQAMVTMLACARLGAPHSLIFGGFASKELSVRIDHAQVGLRRAVSSLWLCVSFLSSLVSFLLLCLTVCLVSL